MSSMVKLRNKKIGSGNQIYIIAEMACAHDGDLEKAKQLVDAAVKGKADAIQLQFFSIKDISTPDHSGYEVGIRIEFSHKEWEKIYDYAFNFGIHVFACTFDLPSAELAIRLGVDGIKINSSDLSNPALLKLVAGSGIPFTLGTGASTIEEIAQAVETCLKHGVDQIIIMHGIQNFPTDIKDTNINKIKMLQSLFPFPVGYQDHTDASYPFSRIIDLLAIGAGASVIEKHITIDNSGNLEDTQKQLDKNFSPSI